MFKPLCALLLGLGAGLPALAAPASPPFVSIVDEGGLAFTGKSCPELAAEALAGQGYARITQPGGAPTVFAAYRAGRDYQYKAVVKCLAEQGQVVVVVVADKAGGLIQANALLDHITRHAQRGTPPGPAAPSATPNCGSGPALIRCLNQVPEENIGDVIEYLENQRR